MGQGNFLDSNAVIDYCGGKLPASSMLKMNDIVNNGFNISPVVKIETLGFQWSQRGHGEVRNLTELCKPFVYR